jgi:hypothetical protein
MPYKPTGNPPGRPRKPKPFSDPLIAAAINKAAGEEAVKQFPGIVSDAEYELAQEVKPLSRARAGFRRAHGDPTAELYHPPRFGHRRQHVGKRPILHPNVIVKT